MNYAMTGTLLLGMDASQTAPFQKDGPALMMLALLYVEMGLKWEKSNAMIQT